MCTYVTPHTTADKLLNTHTYQLIFTYTMKPTYTYIPIKTYLTKTVDIC